MHGLTRAQRRNANLVRDLAQGGLGQPCRVEPAVVTAVATGAAADGHALVTVDWRGTPVEAAYDASYSPAVGHTVWVLVQRGQIIIGGRLIGTP